MKCPYCGTEIKVDRTHKYDTVVLRLRWCEVCKESFKTEEIVVEPHRQVETGAA